MKDEIINIDNNLVKLGTNQTNSFNNVIDRIKTIENNQIKLQDNISWLGSKLDMIIELLNESSDK